MLPYPANPTLRIHALPPFFILYVHVLILFHVCYPPGSRTPSTQLMLVASRKIIPPPYYYILTLLLHLLTLYLPVPPSHANRRVPSRRPANLPAMSRHSPSSATRSPYHIYNKRTCSYGSLHASYTLTPHRRQLAIFLLPDPKFVTVPTQLWFPAPRTAATGAASSLSSVSHHFPTFAVL